MTQWMSNVWSLDRSFGKRLLPSHFISIKQVENWRGSKIPRLSYNFNGNWAAAGWRIQHFTEIALWSCMSLGNCQDIIVGLQSTCCCWLSSLKQGISCWWCWQDFTCFQWDAHCWGFICVSSNLYIYQLLIQLSWKSHWYLGSNQIACISPNT